jgi:hypothetical protein
MAGEDSIFAVEVREGAPHPKDLAVGAGGEPQTLGGARKQGGARFVGGGDTFEIEPLEASIGGRSNPLAAPLRLRKTSRDRSSANGLRGLATISAVECTYFYGRQNHVQIEAVDQRATHPRAIRSHALG